MVQPIEIERSELAQQWLIDEGHMPAQYVVGQGQALGRSGRVHVQRDSDGQVWIGGASVTCIDGAVTL